MRVCIMHFISYYVRVAVHISWRARARALLLSAGIRNWIPLHFARPDKLRQKKLEFCVSGAVSPFPFPAEKQKRAKSKWTLIGRPLYRCSLFSAAITFSSFLLRFHLAFSLPSHTQHTKAPPLLHSLHFCDAIVLASHVLCRLLRIDFTDCTGKIIMLN